MSTHTDPANIGRALTFLREWDRGDRTVRGRMLNTFLTQNLGKTFHELELQFAQVASLFLARLTTWMKLTDQYLMEFLEDGGVLTLLDILGHPRSKEEEKTEALRLLLTVSNAGRKYKEIICESHGVTAIAECLAKSITGETQEMAGGLLESIAHGNPKYQNQIYKGLIALMTCTSPKAQQLALHNLRALQCKMKTAHCSIVEPLLNMLSSLHLEVQDEAIRLILDLKGYDVRPLLLNGLVTLLGPTKDEVQHHTEESEMIKMTGALPVFVQQAAAAKAIHLLAKDSDELSRELLSLGVIQHLLYTMGNRDHADAQMQASLALEHFIRSYPVIEEHVQRGIGSTLFEAFVQQTDTLYMNMDESQAEILLTNKVNITEV